MGNTMKAVYLHAVEDLRIHEEPMPALTSPDDVLIKIEVVGVCGSDCHFYERGRIGPFVVKDPLILGHECSGRVLEVGANVKHLRSGDLVTIEPGVPCRRCARCKKGRYNLCEVEVTFMGTPPWQGAFREYVTWPADFVFKLPEGVSLDDGAMVEPLAVGVHACHRGAISPGKTAAVTGAGPIGLLTAQVAAAYGAHPVFITDVIPFRLELAAKLGFKALNAAQDDVVSEVRSSTGLGVDVVIETAGSVSSIRQAIAMAKAGGTIVFVGWPPEDEVPLPVTDILARELAISSVFRYANAYRPALSLLAAGKLNLAPLRTHEFPLERVEEAILTTLEKKSEAVKVMVKP